MKAVSAPPLLHVCALVAYDGTGYHGFQYQSGVPTIQAKLEEALAAFTDFSGRVIGSGRTDTGVHANGQVIAVHVHWRHDVGALQEAWNAHLPADIVVRELRMAPAAFHPRFSALTRTYRYRVDQYYVAERTLPRRSPLTERYALYTPWPLALEPMQTAAGLLIGEHDFATFGQPPQGVNTVRCIVEADWQVVEQSLPRLDAFPGRRLVFTVRANAFLRHMVRNLVGSLLEVGRGRWSVDDFAAALAACDRSRSAPPAPPNGLSLEQVEYPPYAGVLTGDI